MILDDHSGSAHTGDILCASRPPEMVTEHVRARWQGAYRELCEVGCAGSNLGLPAAQPLSSVLKCA